MLPSQVHIKDRREEMSAYLKDKIDSVYQLGNNYNTDQK